MLDDKSIVTNSKYPPSRGVEGSPVTSTNEAISPCSLPFRRCNENLRSAALFYNELMNRQCIHQFIGKQQPVIEPVGFLLK